MLESCQSKSTCRTSV